MPRKKLIREEMEQECLHCKRTFKYIFVLHSINPIKRIFCSNACRGESLRLKSNKAVARHLANKASEAKFRNLNKGTWHGQNVGEA